MVHDNSVEPNIYIEINVKLVLTVSIKSYDMTEVMVIPYNINYLVIAFNVEHHYNEV